jgi:hypothetical protein
VAVSDTAPVLRKILDDCLKRSGVNITPADQVDHVTMGMSLIASTRGVGLLPAYAQNFLLKELRQPSNWSSATKSRTSLPSRSSSFRDWTS